MSSLLLLCCTALANADEGDDFFEARIRPILATRCSQCHGADKQSNGLRVDSRPLLLQGGDSGPALLPGKPDESLLIQAIGYAGDLRMPPDDPLPAEVVADFVTWVRSGARWPEVGAHDQQNQSTEHWAFAPVADIQPPTDNGEGSDHPIDRFIAKAWRERGLKPVAQADRRTLGRRAYFDLIGLPPTAEQIDAFVNDQSTDAFAQLVEHLLSSPRYGERWGRYWMDVAHYADTAGDNADYPIPEVRLYRDYIIDAFNADKPYDEFVQEQIAGDLLAKAGPREKYAQRVAATGFLALSRRYGTNPKELWHLTIEDTLDTLGQSMLGLTLRCARCHDHKFDPITSEDYYALYGIFESTRFAYAGSEELQTKGWPRSGFMSLMPAEEAQPKLDRFAAQIRALETQIKNAQNEGPAAVEIAALQQQMDAKAKLAGNGSSIQTSDASSGAAPSSDAEPAELKKQLDELKAKHKRELEGLNRELTKLRRPGVPADLAAAYAVSEGEPSDVPIQQRGDPGQPGPIAKRGVPKFLQAAAGSIEIDSAGSGRAELAQWLTRPQNPLTARVMVNRIWQHHFGVGLVATASNFGLRGSKPEHPELLDWLAAQLVNQGWSIKAIHRLILSSQTYQLDSAASEPNQQIDPANRHYWRHSRRRLDAEALRDSMLAVSGNLQVERPDAHPFPPIESWNWTQHFPFKQVYESDHRSVYLMTQRIVRHPYLALFDGPDTNHSTEARTTATVPLQALYLMNNPFVVAQARGFANRLLAENRDDSGRIAWAWRTAWARPPQNGEIDSAHAFLTQVRNELNASNVPDDERELESWSSLAKILLTSNEFLYVD